MKRNKKELPVFNGIKDIQTFWDTHEFTDFQDEFQRKLNIQFDIKNRTYLPINLEEYEKLEKIAMVQHITVDKLIHHWIEEKIAEY